MKTIKKIQKIINLIFFSKTKFWPKIKKQTLPKNPSNILLEEIRAKIERQQGLTHILKYSALNCHHSKTCPKNIQMVNIQQFLDRKKM